MFSIFSEDPRLNCGGYRLTALSFLQLESIYASLRSTLLFLFEYPQIFLPVSISMFLILCHISVSPLFLPPRSFRNLFCNRRLTSLCVSWSFSVSRFSFLLADSLGKFLSFKRSQLPACGCFQYLHPEVPGPV